jgi:phosphatidylserine decarboxylase precursor
VDFFHINMDEFEPSDMNAYGTFEDFFVRKHKPGSRPIYAEEDPSKAVVVADSRVVVYETVAESKKICFKGSDFSIATLTSDNQLGQDFADGAVASFRLSPQDYHRYHSPVSGHIKAFRSIPGDYYQVDPIALQSDVDILTRNARDYVVIETEEFGRVLFVAIGATDVGTVL